MRSLDQLAAQAAQAVLDRMHAPKALDILATKTLGVLQENGVYACVLFLESRTSKAEKPLAEQLRQQLAELLREITGSPQRADDLRGYILGSVANDLDLLLLVKQLWEQMLIYVRYSAKARAAGTADAP